MLVSLTHCRLTQSDEDNVRTSGLHGSFHSSVCISISRNLHTVKDVGTNGPCLSDRQIESVVIAQGGNSCPTNYVASFTTPDQHR